MAGMRFPNVHPKSGGLWRVLAGIGGFSSLDIKNALIHINYKSPVVPVMDKCCILVLPNRTLKRTTGSIKKAATRPSDWQAPVNFIIYH
jgi:hypothetical protein